MEEKREADTFAKLDKNKPANNSGGGGQDVFNFSIIQ